MAGHALRIDCTSLHITPIPLPEDLEVVVVDSGERRRLATSAYAERAAACQAAQAELGPLRRATLADVAGLGDAVMRQRARHVVTENARVDQLAAALTAGDRLGISEAMAASHASLRHDFAVSTPGLDELVRRLIHLDGVIGARLTGAGFGGCVVAIVERATPLPAGMTAWRVRPWTGAGIVG